jgi:cytochrome c oxidase cbb3-type subunit 4
MDINDMRSIVTVLMFFTFIGIVWWAFSSRRKDAYEAAARIPLEDDEPADNGRGAGQTNH